MNILVLYDEGYIKKRVPTKRAKKHANFTFKKMSFKNAPMESKDRYIDRKWLRGFVGEYDGVVAVVDGNKLKNVYGNCIKLDGKIVMQVESQEKLYRKWKKSGLTWKLVSSKSKADYKQLEYTFDHELGHALCRYYNKTDFLHQFISLKKYEDWWDYMKFPTLQENPTKLLPRIKRQMDAFLVVTKSLGFNLRVTSDYRSFEEQDELYAQGRTKPGNIVTNAKGGESLHNYGVAFDVVDRKKGYNLSNGEWQLLAKIWVYLTDNKGVWGGSWINFKDRPHFQNTLDYSIKDFQKGLVDYSKFN